MAGTFTGRDEIFAFLGRLPKETDGTYSSSLIDVLASDDRAAALYRASGERNGRPARPRPGAALPDRGRARPARARAARATPPRSSASGPDERAPLRGRRPLPDRDPFRRGAGRDAGRARRGRAEERAGATRLAGLRRDDADGRRARRDGGARTASTVSRCRSSSARAAPGTPAGSRSPRPPSGVTARGDAGVEQCLAEVRRGLAHGIRSFLVGDLGVLATLGRMRAAGDLPPDLVLKTSVLLPCTNGATAQRPAGARRDDDQRLHRPLRRDPRGDPRRVHRHRSTSTSRRPTTRAASCATTRCRS